MICDSMEFFYVYRSRLQDARFGDFSKRGARNVSMLGGGEWPAPVLRTSAPRRTHPLPRFCGRLLLVSGNLLLLLGERLCASGTASDRVVSHG
jgi:hypothetical protein